MEWLRSSFAPSSTLSHRNGRTTSSLKTPSSTGQTTPTGRTFKCPVDGQHKIRHREPSTVGTLRSRITPLEKNQAGADPSLAISPRWCGKASDGSAPAWFFSKGVILDLRVPTVDGSLCLLLCCPSTGHVNVLPVGVVWPVLKGVFSYEMVRPFLCESVELGAKLKRSHSMLRSVGVVCCQ